MPSDSLEKRIYRVFRTQEQLKLTVMAAGLITSGMILVFAGGALGQVLPGEIGEGVRIGIQLGGFIVMSPSAMATAQLLGTLKPRTQAVAITLMLLSVAVGAFWLKGRFSVAYRGVKLMASIVGAVLIASAVVLAVRIFHARWPNYEDNQKSTDKKPLSARIMTRAVQATVLIFALAFAVGLAMIPIQGIAEHDTSHEAVFEDACNEEYGPEWEWDGIVDRPGDDGWFIMPNTYDGSGTYKIRCVKPVGWGEDPDEVIEVQISG